MTIVPVECTTQARRRMAHVERSRDELLLIAEREPSNPMPRYLLALALRRRGDRSWRDHVAIASALPHVTPQHVYARALAAIEHGEWAGWTDYNARLAAPDTIDDLAKYRELCWKHRAWDGSEDLGGKSLLVLPEQGFGDCLQMWRFIPTLADSVGSVIMMVYPRLVPLAKHNFRSRARIWMDGVKPTEPFDRYVWSMSLPAALGRLPEFRALKAPRRRPKLSSRTRPVRAGICWAGNPDYLQDQERSMPVAALAPLLSLSKVEWFSLQVGYRASEASAYPELKQPNPPLITFADTADVIAELDCVVSVDTSICHLAGSLGVPTYLLLQYDSHWRWGLEDATPWYPTMRLIRQPMPGDWSGVMQSVIGELAAGEPPADALSTAGRIAI
jgi:hypothetical protein